MRILWFGHRDVMHPRAGGAERTMYEVSRRLVRMGHEVTLATVNPGSLRGFEEISGIRVIRVRGNVVAHLRAPRIIRRVGPDLVVDDLAHVVPWLSPYFTDKPVVAFFRHLHARSLRGQVNPLEAEVLKLVERQYPRMYGSSVFVTETETGVRDLVSLGVREDAIMRILPGVDHERWRPAEKAGRPTLVYFGGMKDYKRPWLALKLLRRLGDSRLVVVGSGSSSATVMRICEGLGLCGRVTFTGRVSDEDLPRIVGSAWVNLHFSQVEGFGLSILEAAACGTPTVALDAPGVSEVINEFGLGVTAGNLEDMAGKVQEVLENNGA
ncbi:glycosyltransferase family 4 protein [Conexivisphaera calida]|uniref:glycosyltransferase family 4 protein n=1 Tax=Conexivisphaera calida TaxID=1874277 RepID=UPI00157A6F3D|nr:glycosyltransferase family 4 protein [Conexivisphaera calida]